MYTFHNFRLAALGSLLLVAASTVAAAQPPVSSRNGQRASQRGAQRADSVRVSQRADAQRGGRPGDRANGGQPVIARGLLQGITLTATQKEQLKVVLQRHEAQRADSARIRPGAGSVGVGPKAASRQRPDSAARANMLALRQQQFDRNASEIRSILTADQQTTFDQNVREMRDRLASKSQHAGKGRRGR
jgi:hypothetical protein